VKSRPDKQESREIRVAIRRVLLQVWDPIGVQDEPFAQDEYDGYLGDVYELLLRGAPEDDIANYLFRVAIERMGFARWQVNSKTVEAARALQRIPFPQS